MQSILCNHIIHGSKYVHTHLFYCCDIRSEAIGVRLFTSSLPVSFPAGYYHTTICHLGLPDDAQPGVSTCIAYHWKMHNTSSPSKCSYTLAVTAFHETQSVCLLSLFTESDYSTLIIMSAKNRAWSVYFRTI